MMGTPLDDYFMEIANITSGQHWMDEAHIHRFAKEIRFRALMEAADLTERKFHSTYADCAKSIRELAI